MEAARKRQRQRFEGTDIASNADMRPSQIRKYCVLDEDHHAPAAADGAGVSPRIEIEQGDCGPGGVGGDHPVTLRVTDLGGLHAAQEFIITVVEAPVTENNLYLPMIVR